MRRILVEGFAGGGIKSKQPPCERTSSPAQNPEKKRIKANQELQSGHVMSYNFGIVRLYSTFYLQHNNAQRAKLRC